jgi:hypothetical protein
MEEYASWMRTRAAFRKKCRQCERNLSGSASVGKNDPVSEQWTLNGI